MPSLRAVVALPLALWIPAAGALRRAAASSDGELPAVSAASSADDSEDVSSFISHGGLLCSQAAPRTTEGALALKKAGPHGALYNDTYAANTTCEAEGFTVFIGEDHCYPGLGRFYKQPEHHDRVVAAEAHALHAWAEWYELEIDRAVQMAACACHPKSQVIGVIGKMGGACDVPKELVGSWVHHDPADGRTLLCVQGPYIEATFALATLKQSSQLPMHLYDQIAVANCSGFGFPEEFKQVDHCFPHMRIWTRTPLEHDKGVDASQAVEGELFNGGFLRWAGSRRLNTWQLASQPGCHCLAGSSVWQALGAQCDKPEKRPPIMDWWVG